MLARNLNLKKVISQRIQETLPVSKCFVHCSGLMGKVVWVILHQLERVTDCETLA